MHPIVKKFVGNRDKNSWASQLRLKRFKLFNELLLNKLSNPKILDVGGVGYFWENIGYKGQVFCLNLFIPEGQNKNHNITFIKGDACDLSQFADKSFDIVFSNSVLEHVGDLDFQKKAADEIRRVGKMYFIQTPNKYFVIEPHFLFPLFALFPKRLKLFIAKYWPLGWRERGSPLALEEADTIRLLTYKELRMLFPEAAVYKEKFFGMTKSYMCIYPGE